MDAYIYAADIYCADCGERIRKEIDHEGLAPENPDEETTYDSDEYPKGPFTCLLGWEADYPQHCGGGAYCLNAIELSNGCKIGALLDNPLTTDGLNYLREAIKKGGEVADLWAEAYSCYLD